MIFNLQIKIIYFNNKIQSQIEMNRKKRGISLSHNANTNTHDVSQNRSNQSVNRIQYVRNPMISTLPRQMYTKHQKINFNYSANHSPRFPQYSLNPPNLMMQNPHIGNFGQTQRQTNRIVLMKTQRQPVINILNPKKEAIFTQKYGSFDQCKQQIGKRVLGNNVSNSNLIWTQTSRTNSFIHSKVEELSFEVLQTKQNQNIKTYIPFKPKQSALEQTHSMNTILQQRPEHKDKNLEVLRIENNVEIEIENKQKQIVRKQKLRDPIKLQQMEKRLLELIKICDQNT